MSNGQMRSGQPLGLEKFSGKKGEFTMWKDKVLTHIANADEMYERSLLEKEQPQAQVLMRDFLDGTPEKPAVSTEVGLDKDKVREQRWLLQHWTRAHSALLNLFNQVLPNVFLSGLSDHVSKMNPCDIWKALEQKYGLGDAGGVIELLRQWERLAVANWSDLGTLFSQLKKLRNDINRKMRGLVGKDMVSESWLCMEVLSLLPSEFWGSSISMTEEWFTIENVEVSLRRVFGDRSKKEIGMLTDKRRPVAISVAKKYTGRKRTQDESAEQAAPGQCFYCFDEGHMKVDCPVKAKVRDPERPGGPLFRTNIRTAPGAKKKRVMAVKKGVQKVVKANVAKTVGQPELKKDKAPSEDTSAKDTSVKDTPLEGNQTVLDIFGDMEAADDSEFKFVPTSDGDEDQSEVMVDMEDVAME